MLVFGGWIAAQPLYALPDLTRTEAGIGPPEWEVLWPIRFEAAVWTGERYVIAGNNGYVYYSENGTDWTEARGGDDVHFRAGAASDDGTVVLVGDGGAIFRSANGIDWQRQESASAVDLNDVVFGAGRFVAVGEDGIVLVSEEGIDWQQHQVQGGFTFRGIDFGRGEFWAVGGGGTVFSPRLWRSADGNTWSDGGALPRDTAHSIAVADERIVVGLLRRIFRLYDPGEVRGTVAYSEDGIAWTVVSPTLAVMEGVPVHSVLWTGDSFVAGCAGDTLVSSKDGAFWNTYALRLYLGAAAGPPGLVSVGEPGRVDFWPGGEGPPIRTQVIEIPPVSRVAAIEDWFLGWNGIGEAFVSVDGVGWEKVDDPEIAQMSHAHTAGGMHFLTGGGGILYSEDGSSWERAEIPTEAAISRIVHGNGRFLAVATPPLLSMDGRTWTVAPADMPVLQDAAYGNGLFVGIGGPNGLVYSRDGKCWEPYRLRQDAFKTDLGDLYYQSIHYGNEQFLLFVMQDNPNHPSFGTRPDIFPNQPRYLRNLFWSSNGVNWKGGSSPMRDAGPETKGPFFDDGIFFILGETVAYSTGDGWDWTGDLEWPAPKSVASGENWVIAAGDGILLRSPRNQWPMPEEPDPETLVPLEFYLQPADTVGILDGTAILSAWVAPGEQPSYQWYHEGEAITGATDWKLRLDDLRSGDGGMYWVEAQVRGVTARSKSARLVPSFGAPGDRDPGFYPPEFPDFQRPVLYLSLPGGRVLIRPPGSGNNSAWQLDSVGKVERRYASLNLRPSVSRGDGLVHSGAGEAPYLLQVFDPDTGDLESRDFAFNGGTVWHLALDDDGRLLIGGDFQSVDGIDQPYLARLTSTGTFDTTFLPSFSGPVIQIEVTPDGYVVFGEFDHANGRSVAGMAKIRFDGSVDESFVSEEFDGDVRIRGTDAMGRIYLAGSFPDQDGQTGQGVIRLLPDGTLDPDYQSAYHRGIPLTGMIVQDDGKVIVSGINRYADYSYGRLIRLSEDGSRDPAFSLWHSPVSSMRQQDDGRIVALMSSYQNTRYVSRFEVGYLRRVIGERHLPEYRQWAIANDLSDDAEFPGLDSGGFGIPNLLRYALALDARNPERDHLPRQRIFTVDVEGEQMQFLGLDFTMRPDAVDLDYAIEVSSDLKTWIQVPKANVMERARNWDGTGTETVTVADWVPLGEPGVDRRFIRLRVDQLERKPDLILTDLKIYNAGRSVSLGSFRPLPESDEVRAGNSCRFYATIQNIGSVPTEEGVIHGVSFWVNGDAVNWSDDWKGPLAPGETRHLRANGGPAGIDTWTPAEPGEVEVMAWVDDLDRIEEADEENNQYWRDIHVAPAKSQ